MNQALHYCTAIGCLVGLSLQTPWDRFVSFATVAGAALVILGAFVAYRLICRLAKLTWSTAVWARDRNWRQFDLRGLMLLTALAAIGVYVWEYDRPRRELEAFAAEVVRLGGRVSRNSDGKVWSVDFMRVTLSDAEFTYLAGLPGARRVHSMRLEHGQIHALGLRHQRPNAYRPGGTP